MTCLLEYEESLNFKPKYEISKIYLKKLTPSMERKIEDYKKLVLRKEKVKRRLEEMQKAVAKKTLALINDVF